MPSLSQILNSKIGKGGKSKAYVASQLGVSEKTIENYMNGKREPKQAGLVKLSELLGFNLNDLSERSVPSSEQTKPLESSKNDYTDEYIALLKEKAAGFNSLELKETLELLLAHQRLFYDLFEKLLSNQKPEKGKDGISVRYEMDKALAGHLRKIQQKGISIGTVDT